MPQSLFFGFCIVLFVVVFLGCSSVEQQEILPSEADPLGVLYTDSAALSCLPNDAPREEASVVDVIDGDTIGVEINKRRYRVRYIGIDTPETSAQIEYFGNEATERNRFLVENRKVILIKDISETDRYGRLLRYVLVGDVFVNYELVRGGYAKAYTYPPDIACADIFRETERQAHQEHLGLWTETPMP